MIVALLEQKDGVGKTALVLHLAGQWAFEGKRVIVIDAVAFRRRTVIADLPREFPARELPADAGGAA